MLQQVEKPITKGRQNSAGETTAAAMESGASARKELIAVGAEFHRRGWSLATSSNYSVLLCGEPMHLLITASGKDKSRLTESDFVIVGDNGQPVAATDERPSAETLLHVSIAKQPGVGAVLHTHSIWATLLSDWCSDAGNVQLSGYEMLKGLEGVKTHEATIEVPIFDNTQDIPLLAAELDRRLSDPKRPLRYGFLIHRHGLYTWGRNLAEARRHVEALEFLFEVIGRTDRRNLV